MLSPLSSVSMLKAATAPAAANAASSTAAAAAANAPTTPVVDEAKEASDRFLTLLVTQLRNQDPLSPMDNAQITTQLAQISTVSGINRLNDTVASLSASFAAGQYLQATALVGRDVVVAGNKLSLADGKAPYAMAIAKDADTVTVTIKDPAGVVVRTVELGAQKSGIRTFEWDGMDDAGKAMTAGDYTMSVTATMNGETVATDALTIANVTGVAPTAQGTILMLGSLGTVALSEILQIN